MASFDYRLNPLYAIKECSSCGALYTADFCCSKRGLEDKILVPKSHQNCATCGDPVDGLNCQPCDFVRKCLNEESVVARYHTHADFSLPKYDSFIFDLSINPFPPADRSDFYHEEFADELAHIISPPEYDSFLF
ncbi:hypothetical protein Tco_0568818 [Tanacetum coccineum]